MSCEDGLFLLQCLKVHRSKFGETDLRSARNGKRGTEIRMKKIITPCIYLGLLSVMGRENKQNVFHWTVFDSDQHAL